VVPPFAFARDGPPETNARASSSGATARVPAGPRAPTRWTPATTESAPFARPTGGLHDERLRSRAVAFPPKIVRHLYADSPSR